MHRPHQPTSRQKAVEEGLLEVWQAHLDGLPADDLVNLVLTEQCVKGKIRLDGVRTGIQSRRTSKTGMRTITEWRRPLWSAVEMDREPEALRWLVYYVLRQGPGLLADLWCEDLSIASAAESRVLADVQSKSLKLMLLEDQTRSKFMRYVRRPLVPSVPGCDNTYSEACEYYMDAMLIRDPDKMFFLEGTTKLLQRS
ncbi:MAG: hypothetical protein Q9169_003865 [Polycauliona sp. 2 TL-2023]